MLLAYAARTKEEFDLAEYLVNSKQTPVEVARAVRKLERAALMTDYTLTLLGEELLAMAKKASPKIKRWVEAPKESKED